MTMNEFFSPLLGERYYHLPHASGLNVYVFPKHMSGTYALFATAYGSMDNCISEAGAPAEVLPDGIAHFLEHKLFDNADGEDAFSRFSALGADANAYTSYNRTAYLFNCTDRFSEALEELLGFVTHPYFTEETVKKEQGIIAEEIRMYEDSPWERVYQNLLRALYAKHPVRKNICGTQSSIRRMTPELLYRAHRLFYHPSNMVLAVCGDVTVETVMAVVDRVLPAQTSGAQRPTTVLPPEKHAVAKHRIEAYMPVAKPIFHIGIKDVHLPQDPAERLRRDLAMSLLHEVLFSQAGPFYSSLFEEGLLTPSFAYGYSSAPSFGFHCISGESEDPDEVLRRLREYLQRVQREGICKEDFERCRRALYADEIRAYDSTEEIANRLLSFVMEGMDMFSVPDVYGEITVEELTALLPELCREECLACSYVLPMKAIE